MAIYAILSGQSYGKYLQDNIFHEDHMRQLRLTNSALRYEISKNTLASIASTAALNRSFGDGFDSVQNALTNGFGKITNELAEVNLNLQDLQAEFNYGIGLVVDQLHAQNQSLQDILAKLEEIHKSLKHQVENVAREWYDKGCERIARGLLDKAVEAFKKSEEIEDTNFLVHLKLGKLYMFGKDEDDDVIDLVLADKHLKLAERYSKADLRIIPEISSLVAEILFMRASVCFIQAGELKLKNDSDHVLTRIQEAQQCCFEAIGFNPDLTEARYLIAKCCALLDDSDNCVRHLKDCIKADRNYAIKIENDQEFCNIRSLVVKMFQNLRAESRKDAQSILSRLKDILKTHHFPSDWNMHYSVKSHRESAFKSTIELSAMLVHPNGTIDRIKHEAQRSNPSIRLSDAVCVIKNTALDADHILNEYTYFDNLDAAEICNAAIKLFEQMKESADIVHLSIWNKMEEDRLLKIEREEIKRREEAQHKREVRIAELQEIRKKDVSFIGRICIIIGICVASIANNIDITINLKRLIFILTVVIFWQLGRLISDAYYGYLDSQKLTRSEMFPLIKRIKSKYYSYHH